MRQWVRLASTGSVCVILNFILVLQAYILFVGFSTRTIIVIIYKLIAFTCDSYTHICLRQARPIHLHLHSRWYSAF